LRKGTVRFTKSLAMPPTDSATVPRRRKSRSTPRTTPRVALSIFLDSTYGRQKMQGILAYMRKNPGWRVPIRAGNPFLPWEELKRWRGEGIIGEFYTQEQIDAIKGLGIPAVNTVCGLKREQMPTVGLDDDAVGRMVAEHLCAKGLKELHFFGQGYFRYARTRQKAFIAAAKRSGARVHLHDLDCPNRADVLMKAGTYLGFLRGVTGPCGAFCATDRIAFGVLEACRKLGINVPNQMAVVSSNNDEMLCQLATPPLSSVDEGATALGFAAAELLDGLMLNQKPESRRILLKPAGLRVRASSDILVVGEGHLSSALRFIRDHAHEAIYVPDVQRTTHLSRRSLELLFKKSLGHGIYREIQITHVHRAQQMLRETPLTILEIARCCGFLSLNRFEVAFKKITGCPAATYRKQHLSSGI